MTFSERAATFAAGESGAVTVEWVVLAAITIGICIAVTTVLTTDVETLVQNTGDSISAQSAGPAFSD